jgi:hypothetical protein
MNQPITFLSDGGNTVRDFPRYLHPGAEHILEWFHVTMKLTVEVWPKNWFSLGLRDDS